MRGKYPIVVAVAVLSLLVVGNATDAYSADLEARTETCDPAVVTPDVATLDRDSAKDPAREATCVSIYPNDCGDYPIPQGGSCSCNSGQLTAVGCNTCETGQHGSILVTTCTVCPGPCQNPPCEPVICNQYQSNSCQPGRS